VKLTILTIPNALTFSRLLLIPALLVFAARKEHTLSAFFVALMGLSDFLDGLAARALNQATSFGARLDSLADYACILGFVGAAMLLIPEFMVKHIVYIAISLFQILANNLIKIPLKKSHLLLHLYSQKAAMAFTVLFVIHSFLFWPSPFFFYATFGICMLSEAEESLILLTGKRADEHTKSFFSL